MAGSKRGMLSSPAMSLSTGSPGCIRGELAIRIALMLPLCCCAQASAINSARHSDLSQQAHASCRSCANRASLGRWASFQSTCTKQACSPSMQSRHKDNIVLRLKLILVFAFQLPIGIVDEHKYSRSSEDHQHEPASLNIAFARDGILTSSHREQTFLSSDLSLNCRKATVSGTLR